MKNLPCPYHCEFKNSTGLCTVEKCCLAFAYISVGNTKMQYQHSSLRKITDLGMSGTGVNGNYFNKQIIKICL